MNDQSQDRQMDLLVRVDERTRMIAEEIKVLREQMISRVEFAPVRLVTYGLVGLTLVAVFTALVAQVVAR